MGDDTCRLVDWALLHSGESHYRIVWDNKKYGIPFKLETVDAHRDFSLCFEGHGTHQDLVLDGVCSCSLLIMAHFLLNGEYKDTHLYCGCDTNLEKPSHKDFHRALQANGLAAKYFLDGLWALTKERFRKRGDAMTFKEILQLVFDTCRFGGQGGEDKDLVEYLFERAVSIRPGEEDEEINLKDYMIEEIGEWSYEVMFGHVLKLRAEMQVLKRQQASKATEHGEV
ncbi:hypothetical protein ACHAPI_010338 [Fusarium lateritium]